MNLQKCQIINIHPRVKRGKGNCKDVITDRFMCVSIPKPAFSQLGNLSANIHSAPSSVFPGNPSPISCNAPEYCHCQTKPEPKFDHIECGFNGLEVIPFGIPTYTKKLLLNNNLFKFIERETFRGLPNLLELDMIRNDITDILGKAFEYLKMLEILKLSRNSFTKLHHNVFQGLGSLKELRIGYNSVPLELEDGCFEDLRNLNDLILTYTDLQGTLNASMFKGLVSLKKLDLASTSSHTIDHAAFRHLGQLETLVLSRNNLTRLSQGIFTGLGNLSKLEIHENAIPIALDDNCFKDLEKLKDLSLSQTKIQGGKLTTSMFLGLHTLKVLNLKSCNIHTINKETFKYLVNIDTIDLRDNTFSKTEYVPTMFNILPSLQSLKSDHMEICCIASNVLECDPQPDYLSSCAYLIKSDILRVSLWTIGVLILLGNLIAIVLRLNEKNESSNINCIMIMNLSIADFLMSSYIFIIAAVDVKFRGVYAENRYDWVNGRICMLAGFTASLSSEMSVFILVAMTFDRFFKIVFPFKSKLHLNQCSAYIVMSFGWTLCVILSGLPLLPLNYFGPYAFFSQSGFCLPLILTDFNFKGWEYSFSIFNVTTLVGFILIAGGYLGIFASTFIRRASIRRHTNREVKMARKMLWIVATDFCCWVPISILGFLALQGVQLPGEIFAYISIFVLPINSAINPMIYTFSNLSYDVKCTCMRKRSTTQNSSTLQTPAGSSTRIDTNINYIRQNS
ncbi:unnamed protein product [Owenia fusiformis]|uniref:G-protein coupled receptors family 1 profile domain-containing protein n=1 Tax=Owenia fusiformis TaxID=6347 RepID=A0A8S4NIV0_OWEFU|nr:unnamed protein product [Owenia fusiformis]